MPRETKAQREAREAKEKLEAADVEEKAVEGSDKEAPPQPTIHVLIQYTEDGSIAVEDVVATGDVRATEISDLLTMGRQFWRKKVGLDG